MTVLYVVIPILVVLAGVLGFAVMRRRETDDAVQTLSRETRRSDRGSVSLAADADAPASGREVEKAVVAERAEASKALVLAGTAPPAPYVPPDPETIGVSRRQFFNRSIIGFFVLGLSSFGAAVIAFLWPTLGGGFGAPINIGLASKVQEDIDANNGFLYRADGRMWLTKFPAGAIEKARNVYPPSLVDALQRGGVVALYQKCPHLGCRVPECQTSQWFECPCHGSQYNRVGEKRGGPAPRGMDRFALSIDAENKITVNTGTIIQGPPIGTNTTGQEAEGPNCLGESSH